MKTNTKIIALIIAASLIGGVMGSLISAQFAQANVLGDLWDFFKNNFSFSSPSSSISSSSTSSAPYVSSPAVPYESGVSYEQAVIKAVEKASPSVVSVVISKNLPVIEQCPYNPFGDLPPEFRDLFNQQGFQFYAPCQKGFKMQEVGGGSGFIISSDGLILTNKHVVSDLKAGYTVLTNDGKKYKAKILAQDPAQDLAVLKIEASSLSAVALGDSDDLKLGQTIIAIGNALGEFRNTVSVGVVSGLSRTITASGAGISETIQGVIQTDAAINQGNSGGPLLNLKGEVIGINTAIVSGAQNIGFAIPINQAKRDIESVKKTGNIKTPYLGVRYLMVIPELAKEQKLPVDYGALVRGSQEGAAVIPDSPAAKAGIQTEDIILEINGQKLDSSHPLNLLIQKYNIGDTIILKIQRGVQKIEIKATLEERPAINE